MSEPKPLASLSPSLLARKGAAKPAMRPQLQPLHQFHEATARDIDEDLGWNDMGEDSADATEDQRAADASAEVVALTGSGPAEHEKPEVLRQREQAASRFAQQSPRRSALAEGRRAAFTLRLDADRHLRLRLASTVLGESAQHIVTEALDKQLAQMPELAAIAAQIRERRQN